MFRRVWQRYRGRKSLKGMVADALCLLLIVVAAVPPLRRGVMTYVLRSTLVEPEPYDKILFARATAPSGFLHTAWGSDTTLLFPPARPTVVNTGSTWEAQTRAELRSLDRLAQKYAGRADVYFVSTNPAPEAARYLARKGYTALRLLTIDIDDAQAEEADADGVWAEMLQSEPATIVVDTQGRVRIKKMGAARWDGPTVAAEMEKMLDEAE